MLKALVGALALLLCAGTTQAATVTFVDIQDPTFAANVPNPYIENGIAVTAFNAFPAGPGGTDGMAHLDPDGSDVFPNALSFAFISGSKFSPISFFLQPNSFAYCIDNAEPDCTQGTYKNVLLEGFAGNTLVASDLFDMGDYRFPYIYLFGNHWRGLTRFQISAVLPGDVIGAAGCVGFPCSHFDIDDVVLSPVPVPPALLLLGSALAILGAFRRRL